MTRPTLSPQRRRALQLLGVTAFDWALASRYAHAQSSTGPGPEQLRIGYQKSAVNLVILKQQGVLEKRFPGTRVSWLEFPAGPQLLEALSVGSLEFGLTGDSPPVFAQAAPAQPGMGGFGLLMPIALIAIMYFLMIRPQMKRAKEHRAMLDKLSKGDEVITSGGIAGTVTDIGDNFVTLEVADNVRVRVQKAAVGNVLPKGTLKSA